MRRFSVWLVTCLLAFTVQGIAQQSSTGENTVVPTLINFSGTLTGVNGKPLTGVVGVTFCLYRDAQGGAPLWIETQNVQADKGGHYTVALGTTKSQGLPTDLFASGEARWLGVQPAGQDEQPRVMLLAVPYALKSADAQTLGGLPPSAFVLAPTTVVAAPITTPATTSASNAPTTAPTGTLDFIPLFIDSSGTLGNSAMFQSGSGTTAKVGINTTTPASTLDVKGTSTLRGLVSLPATGVATAAKGSNSQPQTFVASSFNSSTAAAVNQTFKWQAEAAGNNTATPSGTLNLLFGSGTSSPTETGFKIASNGQLTFVSGQVFPGTGTITGVTAGTGLTGGGTTGAVTLNLDTTKVALLSGGNSFTGNQTVSGNVSATQLVSTASQGTSPLQVNSNTQVANLNASFLGGLPATSFQPVGAYASLGANTFSASQTISSGDLILPQSTSPTVGTLYIGNAPFLHACCSSTSQNIFAGSSGNFSTTGIQNTATGFIALAHNTSGSENTASGYLALEFNTTGAFNTAIGDAAAYDNSTGSNNTALGSFAGNTTNSQPTTGINNTFVGYGTTPGTQTALNNATAIGASAEVDQSNALVLGSISGINGASSSVNVGIGTTTPAYSLDVHGTGNFTGLVTFSPTQTFPGAGTITGVTPGTGMTGGGTSGTVTLNVDTTKVPQLLAANTFVGNQSITGNLSTTGNITSTGSVSGGTATFVGSNTTQIGQVTQNGTGAALVVQQNDTGASTTDIGLSAVAAGSKAVAVKGTATNAGGTGVVGQAISASGGIGVTGLVSSTSGIAGVFDNAAATGEILSLRSNGAEKIAVDTFGDLDINGGQLIVASGPVPGIFNATGGGTILIGESKGAQKFSVDGSGNIATSGAVSATSFSGSGTGLTGIPQLSVNNTFLGSQTIQGSLGVGTGTAPVTEQIFGKDTGGTGIQNVVTNASTSGNSFAIVAATSSAGVTTEMAADGLGTGPIGKSGGYFGTYTNQPVGFITNNTERMEIGAIGGVVINAGAQNYGLEVYQNNAPGYGIYVNGSQSGDTAILGIADANVTSATGVYGESLSGNAVWGSSSTGHAGYFDGDVVVTGNLSKGGGSFKIDHPLDPANKYLYHSFVESPDMMNVYNGNVTLDANGEAVVELPDWFESLNRDFRYQLTCIGGFAPIYVAQEIQHNSFRIAGGRAGLKISWQVTGIRQDAWANSHRIPVEEEKADSERGYYLHPDLFGAPEEKGVQWSHHPELMKRMQAERKKNQPTQ